MEGGHASAPSLLQHFALEQGFVRRTSVVSVDRVATVVEDEHACF